MSFLLYVVTYASMLIFLAACIARIFQYSRVPMHLRWELYPVPHEKPSRVTHGGSYFESINWWTEPSDFSLLGELKFMVLEILFLKSLWEHNRKLWFRSFPFHIGLYLLIATLVLLALGAVLSIFVPASMNGLIGVTLKWLYMVAGTAGLILSILGALGLLIRRLADPELKIYTTKGDIFNLLFFIVTLGVLAAGYLLRPVSAPDMLDIVKGLLTLDTSFEIPGLIAAGLFLTALLIAYIPMTHMSHFIAKYYTYHSVRWDDASNRRGGKMEARIAECLAYRPTWAAEHMKADGKNTWAHIAASNPTSEAKK